MGYVPLRKKADFTDVHRAGRVVSFGQVVMYYKYLEGGDLPQLAVCVPGKVGAAVTRNRIKRRIKEVLRTADLSAFRRLKAVIYIKEDVSKMKAGELREMVIGVLARAKDEKGRSVS